MRYPILSIFANKRKIACSRPAIIALCSFGLAVSAGFPWFQLFLKGNEGLPAALALSPKAQTEKDVVETFIAAVSKSEPSKSGTKAFDDAAQYMDFEEMARRGFGDAGWAKFSPEEQKEITSLFRKLMQLRFFPRWRRVFQSGHFSITQTVKQGTDSLVTGNLKMEGKQNALAFRVAKTHDGYKLVSMSVKDKDLLDRTSVRLKRGLKHKGAQGLIAHLRKKTAEASKAGSKDAQLEELISGEK